MVPTQNWALKPTSSPLNLTYAAYPNDISQAISPQIDSNSHQPPSRLLPTFPSHYAIPAQRAAKLGSDEVVALAAAELRTTRPQSLTGPIPCLDGRGLRDRINIRILAKTWFLVSPLLVLGTRL